MNKNNEKYSTEETERRMQAALRGARIAGHKGKDRVAPKQRKKQRTRANPSAPKSS